MEQRTLTDDDLAAIIEAVRNHGTCHMGLTIDEAAMLKRILRAFSRAATLVGSLILTVIVGGLIAIFTRGFWVSLISGVKDVHK